LLNAGRTVSYIPPVVSRSGNQNGDLTALTAEMAAGEVDVLLVVGGNPAYAAPGDLAFATALQNVPLSAHLSLYFDETSALCDWHLPHTHPLEAWGDARAYDGTATVIQPLIQPFYANRSPHQLLALVQAIAENPQPNPPFILPDPLGLLQETWAAYFAEARTDGPLAAEGVPLNDFDSFWRVALHTGVVPGTTFTPLPPAEVDARAVTRAVAAGAGTFEPELVAVFRPDPNIWDGRFANNAWLQELPKPFTKLTWDNAALIGPALAERLGLETEEVIRLRVTFPLGDDADVLAPVFVLPGQADGCITLHLGYGRDVTGSIGEGRGFNAYTVRPALAPWHAPLSALEKAGERYELATTQNHHTRAGRNLVRAATVAAFRENPTFPEAIDGPAGGGEELPSLYPEYVYDGYAWGMSINLNTCIGCQACVVACQAENNIAVVGKEGVAEGREMHWLRVDDYFAGDLDNPRVYHQPVPCMHCEKAPCEPVCPVAATTHSAEGLNEMTYNRCIGTRYCSNNCPYKVRRFNFFDYAADNDLINLMYNPDVTVRSRGVMEKCTYCVQRINRARSGASREGRTIGDGELQTACQEACPANAIVFGNINDPDALVTRLKAQPHDYALLAHLGTRPRTTYLAKLINVNEELP
ncbi:MAG: 4Fe-4S dicluster domain-containing protein, partial [Candidatus Promineifilaceae bacterium]|nr:4Fe-4S dicluster domain-containing protein [Candidatus Promineifilaceae bacterium]